MKDRNSVSSLIHQIAKLEEGLINQQLHELNLNVDQAHTLRYIGDHPGTNQRAITIILRRSAASVSNLLKGLETRNLIEKKFNPDNDREKQLTLTPNGKQTVTAVKGAFDVLDEKVNAALLAPDAIFDQLTQIYQQLKE